MAPLVLALQADPDIDCKVIVTAQHRGLLDDVLAVFGLQADVDLDLMRERQSLEYVTSAALTGVAEALERLKPDFLLVHGDTTTTFAAALAGFYARIPVGHVEAGLRTSTVQRPFPEELNRRLVDVMAAHYYCPTQRAAQHLWASADCSGRIYVTGNTALDAVRLMRRADYVYADPRLAEFAAHPGPKLLLTAHRRENWGAPLASICRGLLGALADFPDARACVCWHPNPAVRETMLDVLGRADEATTAGSGSPTGASVAERVILIDPPRFDAFINLMADCDLLLSDSGGIQEEVTQLGRYVLVLRDETERPEAVEAGFARIVGTDAGAIRDAVRETLPRCLDGSLPPSSASPFGDGHAAERIVTAVREALGL